MPLLINGATIPDHELDREVLRLSSGLEMDAPRAGGIDPAALRAEAMRNVVTRTLLLQAAEKRRLRVTPAEIEAERRRRWGGTSSSVCGAGVSEAIEQDMLLQRVQADLLRHVPRPSRAHVEAYYQRNRQQYFRPEAVEASHIFCAGASPVGGESPDSALVEAEAELRRGKAFAQVANRYSDCKGVGGSVGWVKRGDMVQEFEDVVFALKPGERSGAFQTVFGWHIATVIRRRAAGYQPLEDVRLALANELFAAERQRELHRLLAQMEAGSDIRYLEPAAHA